MNVYHVFRGAKYFTTAEWDENTATPVEGILGQNMVLIEQIKTESPWLNHMRKNGWLIFKLPVSLQESFRIGRPDGQLNYLPTIIMFEETKLYKTTAPDGADMNMLTLDFALHDITLAFKNRIKGYKREPWPKFLPIVTLDIGTAMDLASWGVLDDEYPYLKAGKQNHDRS